MIVNDFVTAMDAIAPVSLAESWDNVGLLLGSGDTEVTGVLVALDVTVPVVEEAKRLGANLIITHHPVIFHGLKAVARDSVPWRVIEGGLSVICAHSNLDIAEHGVNDVLCARLGLAVTGILHDGGLGRVGALEKPMSPAEFAAHIKERLGSLCVKYHDSGRQIRAVAVLGGSGGDYFGDVLAADADAFVTGEIPRHIWLEAALHGVAVMEAGHFHTENVVIGPLAERLKLLLPGIEITASEACSDGVSII